MKKKNIMTAALSLSLVGVIAVGGTLAYFTDTTDTSDNVFVTGNVNITMVDETFDDGNGKVGTPMANDAGIQYTNVLPGDTLNKRVSVKVLDSDVTTGRPASSNAHVGILVTIKANSGAPDEEEVLDLVDAAVTSQEAADGVDTWMPYDAVQYYEDGQLYSGYLYVYNPQVAGRTAGVPAGDELKLFSNIKIPTSWDNDYASNTFDIMVQAFAIQADNVAVSQLTSAVEGMLHDSNKDLVEFQQVDDKLPAETN